jgi:hypothetical protein
MDFTDEQMAAINSMIDAKVNEATAAQKGEIAGLNRTITTLQGEKTAAATAKDQAEADRLATSGTLEDFKARVTTLEGKLTERDAKLRELTFDGAITAAVAGANIRADMREDMIDLLKVRAKYNEAEGTTAVNGQTVCEYLTDLLTSERGKVWAPASGSSGSGATGATDTSGPAAMTKDNFNITSFMNLPKLERDTLIPTLGFDDAKSAALKALP